MTGFKSLGNIKARFFCENCGTEVSPKAERCPSCKKFFTAVKCPKCGFEGNAESFIKGCPMCGFMITPPGEKRVQTPGVPSGRIRRPAHRLSARFYTLAAVILAAVLILLLIILLRVSI
jgi:predicted RNA-binding Zn-ribbon protein involved in translation (DUF1610 family)